MGDFVHEAEELFKPKGKKMKVAYMVQEFLEGKDLFSYMF